MSSHLSRLNLSFGCGFRVDALESVGDVIEEPFLVMLLQFFCELWGGLLRARPHLSKSNDPIPLGNVVHPGDFLKQDWQCCIDVRIDSPDGNRRRSSKIGDGFPKHEFQRGQRSGSRWPHVSQSTRGGSAR